MWQKTWPNYLGQRKNFFHPSNGKVQNWLVPYAGLMFRLNNIFWAVFFISSILPLSMLALVPGSVANSSFMLICFPSSRPLPKWKFPFQLLKQKSQMNSKFLNQFLSQSQWMERWDDRSRLHVTNNIKPVQRTCIKLVLLQKKIKAIFSGGGWLSARWENIRSHKFFVFPSPPLSVESNLPSCPT